jgi:hypothetical protein
MSVSQFIEIKRVTKDKNKVNILKDETIRIEDIKSFRPWFKNEQEKKEIKGEITMLVMKDSSVDIDSDSERKVNTLLVNEAYNDFLIRMRAVVIVR